MATETQQQPIIIIKKAKGHAGHHGGAWKVAFADFMTAMFALFLVLWILTQSQEVKDAVESYFRHPTDYDGRPNALLDGMRGFMRVDQSRKDGDPMVKHIPLQSQANANGEKQLPESVAGGARVLPPESALRPAEEVERPEDQEVEEVKDFLQIADRLWEKMGNAPMFQRFKDNVFVEAREEGLLIQLIEQPKNRLFEDANTEFTPPIKEVFRIIGSEFGPRPNKIEIDGHGTEMQGVYTDSQKWLASAYIAEQARRELERQTIKPRQITKVSGCADARPLDRNADGPMNRRISVLIRPKQWRPERY